MTIQLEKLNSETFCATCKCALVERSDRLVCPNWWPFSGHYRGPKGTTDAVSAGAGVRYGGVTKKIIEVPDAPEGWKSIKEPRPNYGYYQTLNSLTGLQATLLYSESGGWWCGTDRWPDLVTHWRPNETAR